MERGIIKAERVSRTQLSRGTRNQQIYTANQDKGKRFRVRRGWGVIEVDEGKGMVR